MKRSMMNLFIFILSFASMSYEFVLSHTLSILFGDLVTHYILTTSCFIFFMGIGAWCYDQKLKKIKLYKVEYLLSCLSLFIILLPVMSFNFNESISFSLLMFFIITIAFLTGIELPWFLAHSKEPLKTLGIDYLGMGLAGLVFGYIFLPLFGLMETALFIGGLNFLLAVILHYHESKKKWIFVFLIFPAIILFHLDDFNQLLARGYLGI